MKINKNERCFKDVLMSYLLIGFCGFMIGHFKNLSIEMYGLIFWLGLMGLLASFGKGLKLALPINKKGLCLSLSGLLIVLCAIEYYRLVIACFEYMDLNFPINMQRTIYGFFTIFIRVMGILCSVPIFIISMNFILGVLMRILGLYREDFTPRISHKIENKGDIGMLIITITNNDSGVKLVAGNSEKPKNDVVEGTSISEVLRKYADDLEKLKCDA